MLAEGRLNDALREADRLVANYPNFRLAHRSSNLSQKARKRQYWVQEDGRWRIAYEAAVGRPVLRLPESFPRAGEKASPGGDRS